jgi:type VI secretion system protein ImpA
MSSAGSAQKIEIQVLLDPIPGPNPAGESLRYEGTYDRISEARREDDASLSQGIYKTTPKRADWTTTAIICVEALTTRTKDLQIAGWLLESWLHLDGFVGAARGLIVIAGLCERFWDHIYPSLEEDDLEGRLAPFDWIDQKLSLKLKQIPLTKPVDGGERYSFIDWEKACHFENLAMKDPRAMQQAKINPTVSTFRAAMMSTDRSFNLELLRNLDSANDACTQVEELLDHKCGHDAPSLRQFKQALNAIQQLISHDLSVRFEEEEETEMETEHPEPIEAEIELWSSGPIRSRNDAYRRLAEIADYLLLTEPHSPTPYLVRRAVEWGNMSLPELLQQIVRNENELNEIDRLLWLTDRRWQQD